MAYDANWKPKHNPWAIALTVTLATFMEVLDTSIANVALPHMAGSLGASQDEATWVLTSYLVASAIILPISGWLSDRFGRKRFYITCVIMFTVCSLLCGLAPTLPFLIVARVLQGLGGGGLAPSEQAILADTFPVEKRGQAFAVYGMAVVVAPAIGPTLGGWITDNFNWHWIFFINIPIGLFSIWLSSRMVEDPPQLIERRKASVGKKVDFTGLALVAGGVGVLEFFLDKGQEKDWFGSSSITTAAIVAAVLLITFVFWEWHHEDPIVDLKLLKNRNFGTAVFLQLVLGMVLFGSTVLIPQYLQVLLGYTAELAGLVLSPAGLMMMCMMPIVGFLVGRVDPRKLIAFGFFLLTSALMEMHTLNLGVSYNYLVFVRCFQASGLAFLFIPINTIAYIGVKQSENNDVSGLTNLARNIGGSCGTAFLATMLTRRTAAHESNMVRNLTSGNPAFMDQVAKLKGMFGGRSSGNPMTGVGSHSAQAYIYNQLHRQATMLSYLDIIQYLAIFCACMIPLIFFIPRPPKHASPSAGH